MQVKTSSLLLVLIITLGISSSLVFAADILPAPKKISEHVYAWVGPYGGPTPENKGFRMNMAFVVGGDAIAVAETGFYPEMAQEMVKHIRKISSLPIKYAINTNSQPDRYFGNDVFFELGATIIAHEKEIERMKELVSNHATFVDSSLKLNSVKAIIPKMPTQSITENTQLDLGGGVIVKLSFHKAAHTPAPLVVSIPGDNVVYAGDILYGGRLLAIIPGGNVREWIATFDYLRTFSGAVFVPGHGEPGALATFEKPTYQYLRYVNQYMTDAVKNGVDMQEAINKFNQSEYSTLENFDELAGRNANIAYQEAERAAFE